MGISGQTACPLCRGYASKRPPLIQVRYSSGTGVAQGGRDSGAPLGRHPYQPRWRVDPPLRGNGSSAAQQPLLKILCLDSTLGPPDRGATAPRPVIVV